MQKFVGCGKELHLYSHQSFFYSPNVAKNQNKKLITEN
jgi:hypothetical protein